MRRQAPIHILSIQVRGIEAAVFRFPSFVYFFAPPPPICLSGGVAGMRFSLFVRIGEAGPQEGPFLIPQPPLALPACN